MADKVYKVIEIVGTSSKSIEEAVQSAVAEAKKSLKALAWFEVKEIRGGLNESGITEYQVIVKVGFRLVD